jgi:hypothetical protein
MTTTTPERRRRQGAVRPMARADPMALPLHVQVAPRLFCDHRDVPAREGGGEERPGRRPRGRRRRGRRATGAPAEPGVARSPDGQRREAAGGPQRGVCGRVERALLLSVPDGGGGGRAVEQLGLAHPRLRLRAPAPAGGRRLVTPRVEPQVGDQVSSVRCVGLSGTPRDSELREPPADGRMRASGPRPRRTPRLRCVLIRTLDARSHSCA